MAQILYKFDYRDYEVQLLRIEPLFIFHDRPVCHLYLKFIPYFGLSHLIKHLFIEVLDRTVGYLTLGCL